MSSALRNTPSLSKLLPTNNVLKQGKNKTKKGKKKEKPHHLSETFYNFAAQLS